MSEDWNADAEADENGGEGIAVAMELRNHGDADMWRSHGITDLWNQGNTEANCCAMDLWIHETTELRIYDNNYGRL